MRSCLRSFPCLAVLVAILAISQSSCFDKRADAAAPQLPVPEVSTTPDRQPPAPEPAAPEQTTPVETQPAQPSTQTAPAPAQSVPPVTVPSPTPMPQRPPARPATPAPTTPPAPVTPPAPAPLLAPMLTPDQQRQYSADIDQSLEHAQASLRSIGNRQLTKEQQADLNEVRNFMHQAEATRASDLAGAKRLAERAEVLARNLERSAH